MNQRIEKIKQHFHNNKKVYITGGVCLVVGAAGGVLYASKKAEMIVDAYKLQINSPTTNNIITQLILPALGDPGNVVQCIETGTIYASQRQAAKELGLSTSNVSKHLHGQLSHVKGNHLKVIGKAGQPLAG